MRGRLPLLLITTLLSLTGRAQDSQVNADWKQFRKLYPYHIQAVALSEVHPDGHRSLIVSEPPPQVTLENLEHVSPDFATAFTGKQPIGVDGWVKDVIFDLPPLSQTALSLDIDLLHRKLFGTAYKAYALAIPSVLQQPTLRSLDLHVGSSDLAAWLLPTPTGSRIGTGSASLARTASVTARPRITFTPLLGGAALTCETILKSQTGGVFLSQPAGMVLWSVSKSRPIDSLSVQIRRFAVDTDMIVGAVALGDQVAIIGRERTTDVSRLPPLRAETVLQLAAAKEDELEQSYERNILMAGPAVDSAGRSVDWAPILLSPRLIDTEYGSLLNITDQLLKGWSE